MNNIFNSFILPTREISWSTFTRINLILVHFHVLFPIKIMLTIALVLSPTSAACERRFSSMKLIKRFLRNSMSNNQLNSVAVIGIHKKRAKQINMNTFIDLFASKQTWQRDAAAVLIVLFVYCLYKIIVFFFLSANSLIFI